MLLVLINQYFSRLLVYCSDIYLSLADNAAPGESKRIVVPVAADPIQQEALNVLKKLKVIYYHFCKVAFQLHVL